MGLREMHKSGLGAAHSGYIYQDLVAAYLITSALVEPTDRIIVDRKVFEGDRIDDLEVVVATRRVRRQIKYSVSSDRRLSVSDFKFASGLLRLDELVLTHVYRESGGDEEYRLCATWDVPNQADELGEFLEEVYAEPTIAGSAVRTFRLNGPAIWPQNEMPKWRLIATNDRIERTHFIDFCSRFIIELLLPRASLDFMNPGPIEGALLDLLSRGVGVGRYPNDDLRVEDVAAQAVFVAETARSTGASLTPDEIVTRLRLRRDYGHIAQAFPLDPNIAIERPGARAAILRLALDGALQIVTAPPGAGKSWELTQLADDLRERGAIVARHYCYLDPSDDQSARRITSNAFFGNLIYELTTVSSELRDKSHIGFSADSASLERLLSVAADCGKRVVLIVDGLDHIARVRVEVGSVAANQSDIVDQLAAIEVPPSVSIVIGSQPGDHLAPLRSAWASRLVSQTLNSWELSELVELSRAHGVEHVLQSLGFESEQIQQTVEMLAARAEGNPLYARALSVELLRGSKDGSIASPLSWLRSDEGQGGGLMAYYKHLYDGEISNHPIIADVLGALDFAVTTTELQDIVGPLVCGHVEPALHALQPVLSDASAQGGVRIFHESFRRFIRDRMAEGNRSVSDVLSPVIQWLQRRGPFADALSFRFLISALARAGFDSAIWNLVDHTFVQQAIGNGHSLDPILANISLSAEVARRAGNWPMLVRALELRRAALTAFDPSQNDWEEYLEGFAAVFGHGALAARLLFDGRPTLRRNLGLFACDLVDRCGGVPPWREYLSLAEEASDRGSLLFGAEASLDESEALTLQIFRGRLRLPTAPRTLRWFYRNLSKNGDATRPVLVRGFARVATDVFGADVLAPLTMRVVDRATNKLSPRTRALLLLGVAESANATGATQLCQIVATSAAAFAPDAQSLVRCLELGASLPQELPFAVDPRSLPIGVGPDRWAYEAAPIRQWIAEIRFEARRAVDDPNIFAEERARVAGAGWYRSWLGFIMNIALIEAANATTEEAIIAAFEGLERDAAPFLGEPRACDISTIRDLIAESIARGLSFVRTRAMWSKVLPIVARVSESTLYTLQGEDSGAIPTGSLLHLLLGCIATGDWGDIVLQAIEDQIQRRHSMHYPTLAEFMIVLARARQSVGNDADAVAAWSDAIGFIAGYGWRKDSTVYELLESFDALASVAPERALSYAVDLQDIVDAVVRHTDGKGTKAALNGWLQSVLAIAPAAGGFLFARSTADDADAIGWKSEEALRLIASALLGRADPRLLESLLLSIPLREYTDSLEPRDVETRFAPIRELAKFDPASAATHFRVAYATLCNDTSANHELRALAHEMIKREGVLVVECTSCDERVESQEPTATWTDAYNAEAPAPSQATPTVSFGTTLAELYRGLRAVARLERYNSARDELWAPAISVLVERIAHMLQQDQDDEAEQVLYFFARDAGVEMVSSEPHPLAVVAAKLEVRGHLKCASVAYTLAYTSTRSDWLGPFGGSKHRSLMTRAIQLDKVSAQLVYADQLTLVITRSRYLLDVTADVLRQVSEWSDADMVERCWQEVLGQLSVRTPGLKVPGRFVRLASDDLNLQWSLDEVAISLLLARASEPRIYYKLEALRGIVHAIRWQPDNVVEPLRWWLSVDAPRTSRVLILSLLMLAEAKPYKITRGIAPNLDALIIARSYLLRDLARRLLERSGMCPVEAALPQGGEDCVEVDVNWREVETAGGWAALRLVKKRLRMSIDRVERRAYAALPDRRTRKDRAELMFGMHFDARPPTPTILCETEELFRAVDDGLSDESQSEQAGPDTALLQKALTPDLGFYLGRAGSRCPRPPWPRPTEVTPGVRDDFALVGDDDPRFTGWTRIALLEHEYVLPAGSRDHEQPNHELTQFSGIVAWPRGVPIPSKAFPFLECGEVPEQYGPLAGASRETHWLGYPWRLEPPLSLVRSVGLKHTDFAESIAWTDEQNRALIALRSWRVIRADPTAEPATLVGCDLVAHPQAIAQLRALHGDLRELTVTERAELYGPVAGKHPDNAPKEA
jgi:hypothetical protein